MKNLFLRWEPSHIASVSDKAVGVTLENTCVISEVQYFDFLVSYLYTFNPLSSLSKWVTTLVATTYRNMENGQSWKTSYITMVRWLESTPFIFVFKLSVVLQNSYQADEIVKEIEEWKRNNIIWIFLVLELFDYKAC